MDKMGFKAFLLLAGFIIWGVGSFGLMFVCGWCIADGNAGLAITAFIVGILSLSGLIVTTYNAIMPLPDPPKGNENV